MTFSDEFTVMTCITCGVRHGIPTVQYRNAVEQGKFAIKIYCPNGHWYGWGETELDRTRQERDRLKQQAAQKDDEIVETRRKWNNEAAARNVAEAKAKRIEKRAKAALCPCCNRSFIALARHMATKHPNENVVRMTPTKVRKGVA